MPARDHRQRLLPPMELRNVEEESPAFQKSEDGGYAVASEIFDAALGLLEKSKDPKKRLTNKEVAWLCGVSESLVHKWRSPGERACPSFAQMMCLPPRFHLALHRAMDRRYGFGRAALAQLVEAAGALALVIGE